ncbi:hypothetical protein ACI2IY_23780 [Lysobacter enzymogenes]|uniref:hypothetical protein n=1 Tax=Lysobacter enzymogenes TaxID=69 RepID=UPI00384E33BD
MKRLFAGKKAMLLVVAGIATFSIGFAYAATYPCVECGIERDRCLASGENPTLCQAMYKTCWQENGCNPANPGNPR